MGVPKRIKSLLLVALFEGIMDPSGSTALLEGSSSLKAGFESVWPHPTWCAVCLLGQLGCDR